MSSSNSTSLTPTLSSFTDSPSQVPSSTMSSSSEFSSVSPSESSTESLSESSTAESSSVTHSSSESSFSESSSGSSSESFSTESSSSESSEFPTSSESSTTSSTPPPSPSPSPPPPPPPPPSFRPSLTTTLSTTAFITTTDSSGHTTTSAPPELTSTLTTTGNDGRPVTVTVIQLNPTLSLDQTSATVPAFFRNVGAVAGVFLLVGLTAASIILWVFFAIRRRRRRLHPDPEPAPAHPPNPGTQHKPLSGEVDAPQPDPSRRSSYGTPEMALRSSSGFAVNTISSLPSGARTSVYLDTTNHDPFTGDDPFNPYTEYSGTAPPAQDYSGSRTPHTSSSTHLAHYHNRVSTGSAGDRLINPSASGSIEPFLASYYNKATPEPRVLSTQTPPPGNPRRTSDTAKSSPFLTQSEKPSRSPSTRTRASIDDRLDPNLHRKLQRTAEPQDNEDYSRPVLAVRNVSDSVSQASHHSR
ncbi:hypothetical protein AX16_009538 [Volvariella volvacea WC 439]|nr:hypothetical protein AX16_009538 [Volvariella volvacea WC 439]